MKGFKLIMCFLVGFIILQACKDEPKKAVKTEKVVFTKEGELKIYRRQTDSLMAKLDIEFAQSEYETQTGLMYRQSMKDNQGMLFIFPDEAMHSFYMKNTEFPLDIIFIDSNLEIASFQENAQPLSEKGLTSKVPIQYVLEVNAGLVKKWSLGIGDNIKFEKF